METHESSYRYDIVFVPRATGFPFRSLYLLCHSLLFYIVLLLSYYFVATHAVYQTGFPLWKFWFATSSCPVSLLICHCLPKYWNVLPAGISLKLSCDVRTHKCLLGHLQRSTHPNSLTSNLAAQCCAVIRRNSPCVSHTLALYYVQDSIVIIYYQLRIGNARRCEHRITKALVIAVE